MRCFCTYTVLKFYCSTLQVTLQRWTFRWHSHECSKHPILHTTPILCFFLCLLLLIVSSILFFLACTHDSCWPRNSLARCFTQFLARCHSPCCSCCTVAKWAWTIAHFGLSVPWHWEAFWQGLWQGRALGNFELHIHHFGYFQMMSKLGKAAVPRCCCNARKHRLAFSDNRNCGKFL